MKEYSLCYLVALGTPEAHKEIIKRIGFVPKSQGEAQKLDRGLNLMQLLSNELKK